MSQKVVTNSDDLAKRIKTRRIELNLTIEDAAIKAGVGTKTWSRYEAGNSIRADKCKGICRALNWQYLPSDQDGLDLEDNIDYTKHSAWSSFLAERYGYTAAKSFAIGSDILLDKVYQDVQELAKEPRGTHLGQLQQAFTLYDLPEQFLMYYDYDFMYRFKCAIIGLREKAHLGYPMIAHTVLDEIIYYMCVEEAKAYVELDGVKEEEDLYDWDEWIYEMFDDADVVMFLFSDEYITEENMYHFIYWDEQQLWMDKKPQ